MALEEEDAQEKTNNNIMKNKDYIYNFDCFD